MSRPRSRSRETLVERAMTLFWRNGYHATSMEDLVRVTGVGRGGVYSDFGGKRALFLACLERYRDVAVTPAFARVEAEGAGLDAIEAFFEQQIARMEAAGPPAPGCLIANTMTELGPHDEEAQAQVRAHHERLRAGFLNALGAENASGGALSDEELEDLARFLAVSAQGLWSFARSQTETAPLRRHAEILIMLARARIRGEEREARPAGGSP